MLIFAYSISGGHAKVFEAQSVPCPVEEEKEFLLMSKRTEILRVNLRNLTDQELLPLENVKNVITFEYDLEEGCIFYGDEIEKKIFKQCLNGSAPEILVHQTETVEGKIFELIRKFSFFHA